MRNVNNAGAIAIRQMGRFLPLMLGIVLVGSVPLNAANKLTAVVDAARVDDLAEVRKLISEHEDVNTPSKDGSSALLWAAYHANALMVNDLLTAGASVDHENHFGVTPLLQASRDGDTEVIRLLLEAGADATRWHPEGETPLMAAARTGSVEAVQLLLDAGAFINAVDPFQEETALMWAAAEGQVDVVKTLLAAGADPNLQAHVSYIEERKNADHPSGGFTALMFAARNGHEEVVRTLMEGGADPNLTNADGATAAMIAIYNDRFDLAKEMMDLGADPNDGSLYFAVDMHDQTYDTRAQDATRFQPDHENELTALTLIKALLDLGADPNKPFVGAMHSTSMCCGTSFNSSPIFRAASAADVEVLKLLLADGAEVEWSPAKVDPKDGKGPVGRLNGNVGRTPIMMAMKGGKGPPIQGGPGYARVGPAPFREPGSRDPLEALQVLLDAGADPNAKAPDGSTPLHQAVQAQKVAMIRALANAGAALDAVNKDNLTPLLLAESIRDKDVKPAGPNPRGPGADKGPKKDTPDEVVAALRELMHLGPDDPAPQPPPVVSEDEADGADAKTEAKVEEKKSTAETSAETSAP